MASGMELWPDGLTGLDGTYFVSPPPPQMTTSAGDRPAGQAYQTRLGKRAKDSPPYQHHAQSTALAGRIPTLALIWSIVMIGMGESDVTVSLTSPPPSLGEATATVCTSLKGQINVFPAGALWTLRRGRAPHAARRGVVR
eukprot:gene2170-biopygen18479